MGSHLRTVLCHLKGIYIQDIRKNCEFEKRSRDHNKRKETSIASHVVWPIRNTELYMHQPESVNFNTYSQIIIAMYK